MSFLSLFKAVQKSVVVDGVSFAEVTGTRGRMAPRNQLQMLRRLSRFANREKVGMTVVLCGSPLNKAPGGKKFEGVLIIYSKSEKAHAGCLIKTIKKAGRGAVLVVENKTLEAQAHKSGLDTMRVNTFRKAFEAGSFDGERERGNDRDRSRSQQRRRSPNRPQPVKDVAPVDQGQKEDRSEQDAINDLIDLID
ncbi:MAG: hypothetical protein K9M45_00400 [Kiritimatiellales bacterium]|nr:hypothetical protein [Kiritimatiellales bacterium]